MIGVSVKIVGWDRHTKWVAGLQPKTRLAIRSGMSNGGDKVRTDVRKALQIVSGATKYGSIVKRSQGFFVAANSGGTYVLRVGRGDGDNKSALPWLKADEFRERITGAGVVASPWAKPRLLKRSFVVKGREGTASGYRARLPGTRKTRPILGPNLAKEFVSDIPAYVVRGSINTRLVPELVKRLERAWGN